MSDAISLLLYTGLLAGVYRCWSRSVERLLTSFVHSAPRAHLPIPLPWGQSTLYVGPMFAEKTTRACEMLTHMLLEDEDARALVVRHDIDTRSPPDNLTTHGQHTLMSMLLDHGVSDPYGRVDFVSTPGDLSAAVQGDAPWYDVVVVDEAQFFNDDLSDVVRTLLFDKTVLLTGLRATSEREPWGTMSRLLASVDHVHMCYADCSKCRRPCAATHTRRKRTLDSDSVVAVGGEELYYAVCPSCS